MKFVQVVAVVGSAIISSLLSFNVMVHALWLEKGSTEPNFVLENIPKASVKLRLVD